MTGLTLPDRPGDRPRTQLTIPHSQLSQTSPEPIRARLLSWMNELPGVRSGPSEISVPETVAFFLKPHQPLADGALLMPPRRTAEFAHVHLDGSLHLSLAPADQDELLAKGWGERHPRHSSSNNVLMLYAPRDADDLVAIEAVLAACYHYATGTPL